MLEALWSIIIVLAPWLLAGTAIAAALHVLLPPDFAQRQLSGAHSVAKAVAVGVPLPLCSCGVIPLGLGLKKGGASNGAIVGFLISTPQTGVDSVLVSAAFLGWPFAVLKVATAAVTGLVGGWITDSATPSAKTKSIATMHPVHAVGPFREFCEYGMMLIRSIWVWLVVGVLASACLTVFLPHDALAGLQAFGGIGAMGATLLISTPLYVCATASAPIAAALVASGLPPGAALVFLMAGPATNVATLGAVYRTLGSRTLGIYLATVIVGSVASGMAFGFVIDPTVAVEEPHVHATPWWKVVSGAALVGLVAWFAVDGAVRRLRTLTARRPGFNERTIGVSVEGMTCNGCVSRLQRALVGDSEIDEATVTLSPGRAVVHGQISEHRLRELVLHAGFQPLVRRDSHE
ncbi:MAG: permease [Planctomycetota bacterium]